MKRIGTMKTLTVFVIVCLMFVILYIITAIIVQVVTGMPLPDSLTVSTLGLFGTELAVCGFLKIFKIRKE